MPNGLSRRSALRGRAVAGARRGAARRRFACRAVSTRATPCARRAGPSRTARATRGRPEPSAGLAAESASGASARGRRIDERSLAAVHRHGPAARRAGLVGRPEPEPTPPATAADRRGCAGPGCPLIAATARPRGQSASPPAARPVRVADDRAARSESPTTARPVRVADDRAASPRRRRPRGQVRVAGSARTWVAAQPSPAPVAGRARRKPTVSSQVHGCATASKRASEEQGSMKPGARPASPKWWRKLPST